MGDYTKERFQNQVKPRSIGDARDKETANKYNATFATVKQPVEPTALVCVHLLFSPTPLTLREPLDLLGLDLGINYSLINVCFIFKVSSTPNMGLELMTPRSRVQRTTD